MSRNKVNTMSPADFNDLNKATLEKDLQETKDRIANIKSMGADVEAAEIIMTQAEKALEEGNLEMTKAMIDSTIRTFTLIKQQYFIQAASILFSSLQRSIVSLEGAGSEVNYIKDLYNRAKEKFDSGQYEEAMDYIKSAEDMVNDLTDSLPEERRPPATEDVVVEEEAALKEQLTFEYDRSQEQMERVSQVLIRVEKLLQEAIVAGYSVNEAEKLYSLAEDAFDYQDYKKAEEYSLQCESSLEEILRPLHEAQTRVAEEGGTIEPPEEQKAIREDIPTGNRFTNKDKGLSDIMPKGIIGDAPKAEQQEVKTPEEKAIDLELAVEKEATNLLITADEKITMAKDSGLNIPMAERLLSIGESYFDRGEFDKVKEYAEKAIQQINEVMIRKGISTKPKDETPPEEVAEEDVVEDPELEETPAHPEAIQNLESSLMAIKSEIDEARTMGLAIDDAEELIEKSLDEFNSTHYTAAQQFATTAKKELKNLKKDFIKKKALEMVKYAWKELEKAEDEGIDITMANELLQNSRDLVKNGKYQKAAELAMQSLQTIKGEMDAETD